MKWVLRSLCRRQLLNRHLHSRMRNCISSTMWLECAHCIAECVALTVGWTCTAGFEHQQCLHWHSIPIDVGYGYMLFIMFCCLHHLTLVWNIHAVSWILYHIVLNTNQCYLFSGHHLIIFDGNWPWYALHLPWTTWKPVSQLALPRPCQWLYKSFALLHHPHGEYMNDMACMWYCRSSFQIGSSECTIHPVKFHTGIVWSCILLSLLGSKRTGRLRCLSPLSKFGAALCMYSLYSLQYIVYNANYLQRSV